MQTNFVDVHNTKSKLSSSNVTEKEKKHPL